MAFTAKAQTLGDGSAGRVVYSRADLHSIEIHFCETVLDQRATGAGYDAFALGFGSEPVADLAAAFLPGKVIETDGANEYLTVPDSHFQTFPVSIALAGRIDKGAAVLLGLIYVEPGQPAAQVVPVLFDQCK